MFDCLGLDFEIVLRYIRSFFDLDATDPLSPVDGGWSGWSGWGDCSASRGCGRGVQRRLRTCSSPAPVNGGAACRGQALDRRDCSVPCLEGSWVPWSSWSACGSDCIQRRHRSCDSGNQDCKGESTETQICSSDVCSAVGVTGNTEEGKRKTKDHS